MKTKITLLFAAAFLLNFQFGFSQSFEATNFPDLTTTPSASRSVNFIDINGDGWDDIFVSNGLASGQNNLMYINDTNLFYFSQLGPKLWIAKKANLW